jgi:hypothetical protein
VKPNVTRPTSELSLTIPEVVAAVALRDPPLSAGPCTLRGSASDPTKERVERRTIRAMAAKLGFLIRKG